MTSRRGAKKAVAGEVSKTFRRNLRWLKKYLRWTDADFAHALGQESASNVSGWLGGQLPSVTSLALIVEKTRVSPSWLLYDDGEPFLGERRKPDELGEELSAFLRPHLLAAGHLSDDIRDLFGEEGDGDLVLAWVTQQAVRRMEDYVANHPRTKLAAHYERTAQPAARGHIRRPRTGEVLATAFVDPKSPVPPRAKQGARRV